VHPGALDGFENWQMADTLALLYSTNEPFACYTVSILVTEEDISSHLEVALHCAVVPCSFLLGESGDD